MFKYNKKSQVKKVCMQINNILRVQMQNILKYTKL